MNFISILLGSVTISFLGLWFYKPQLFDNILNIYQYTKKVRCCNLIKDITKNWFLSRIERVFGIAFIQRTSTHTILTYHDGTEEYKIKWERNSNPVFIKHITNKNGEDITEVIKPYLGPDNNFHGMKLSPSCLNLDEVHFHYILPPNQKKTFELNEIMTIH